MGQVRILDWSRLRHLWRDAGLPVSLLEKGIIDVWMTLVFKKIMIDLSVLDDRLRAMHPEDGEDISMKDMIIKHYGETAEKFFEEAFL